MARKSWSGSPVIGAAALLFVLAVLIFAR